MGEEERGEGRKREGARDIFLLSLFFVSLLITPLSLLGNKSTLSYTGYTESVTHFS